MNENRTDKEIKEEIQQMKRMKVTRSLAFIITDIGIVILSIIMPMILRFGVMFIEPQYIVMAKQSWYIDVIIALVVFALCKLYNRVWTYASVEEMVDCIKAVLIVEVIYIVYKSMIGMIMFRSYYPFNFMIMLILLCSSRMSVRIGKRIIDIMRRNGNAKRLMVIGSGSAGSILIKEMTWSSDREKVVCVIDDNIAKKGKLIHNVPIVGTRDDIEKKVLEYNIEEIIIALPSEGPQVIGELIRICQKTNAKIRILPEITKSLTTSLNRMVRDINYDDLLGRDSIEVENPEIREFLRGKTVMVTGGGGSIGSELCRQITANKPDKLILVDIYENTTYEIERELDRRFPGVEKKVLIASVRDIDRMEEIVKEYRPQVIYHAAAHKHVPLMEASPNEAIKNNCKGTLNMVQLADKYGVERFVLISTDKAVRPTNVMGASKRICEMIVQTYNNRSNTEFVAVRFGNVLGSNGSVIPFFIKQIDMGGPVTVTHREITRFFMTIPEAVSLVIKAGMMAKGGEIFVLDMGEPVKIYDLACNLIKMKGYVPEKDIKIEITGLRPGEKLYEELLMDEEGIQDTEHSLIHIGKPIDIDEESFLTELEELFEKAEDNSADIKEAVAKVCTTYTPQ